MTSRNDDENNKNHTKNILNLKISGLAQPEIRIPKNCKVELNLKLLLQPWSTQNIFMT